MGITNMKFKFIKDKKYKTQFFSNENFQKTFKLLKFHCKYKKIAQNSTNYLYSLFLLNYNKYISISKTKLKNRCVITNNSRSLIKKYTISRNYLKFIIQFNLLPGCKKAVW